MTKKQQETLKKYPPKRCRECGQTPCKGVNCPHVDHIAALPSRDAVSIGVLFPSLHRDKVSHDW